MASGRPVAREHLPDRGHVRVKLRLFAARFSMRRSECRTVVWSRSSKKRPAERLCRPRMASTRSSPSLQARPSELFQHGRGMSMMEEGDEALGFEREIY